MKNNTPLRNILTIISITVLSCSLSIQAQIQHGSIMGSDVLLNWDNPQDDGGSKGNFTYKVVTIGDQAWGYMRLDDESRRGNGFVPDGTPGRIMNWVADIPPILGNDNLTWNKNDAPVSGNPDYFTSIRLESRVKTADDKCFEVYGKGWLPADAKQIGAWSYIDGMWGISRYRIDYKHDVANSRDEYDLDGPVMESAKVSIDGSTATFDFSAYDEMGEFFYIIKDEANGIQEVSFVDHFIISDLDADKTYNFTVTPIDFSANEGESMAVTSGGEVDIEQSEMIKVTVAPNPATDIINIMGTDISKVELYTIDGKLAMTAVENIFNISSLNKGLYILHIHAMNGSLYSKKISIK